MYRFLGSLRNTPKLCSNEQASELFEHPQGQPHWPSNTPKGAPHGNTNICSVFGDVSIFGLPTKHNKTMLKRRRTLFNLSQQCLAHLLANRERLEISLVVLFVRQEIVQLVVVNLHITAHDAERFIVGCPRPDRLFDLVANNGFFSLAGIRSHSLNRQRLEQQVERSRYHSPPFFVARHIALHLHRAGSCEGCHGVNSQATRVKRRDIVS